jgi:hypothetical protein
LELNADEGDMENGTWKATGSAHLDCDNHSSSLNTVHTTRRETFCSKREYKNKFNVKKQEFVPPAQLRAYIRFE